jgi:ATP-dependent DNA ligase
VFQWLADLRGGVRPHGGILMSAKYGILKALEFSKLSAPMKRCYKDENALLAGGWWPQAKFDGVFGMAGISADGKSHMMWTRTGEPISSCDHILKALYDQAQAQSGGWDSFVVLGELWHPTLPFPTISGDVRRHRASPHLQFVMNDILPPELVTDRPYRDRYADLMAFATVQQSPVLTMAVAPVPVPAGDVIAAAQAWVLKGGYDGLILRDPSSPYTIEEAKAGQIVKVKPKLTLDLTVTAVHEKPGAKTGRPVFTVTVTYRGVSTDVGAGMPHVREDVPRAGQLIEIECLGITADGALREPVYKGQRFDKYEADK